MNKRKCKSCSTYTRDYIAINNMAFCNSDCAVDYARANSDKARKKATREKKVALRNKCKKTQKEKAQAAFNKAIRVRDKNLPCISCGRYHEGQYHAGHYKTRGAHPELALHPLNCHKQCAPCNNHLSGNLVNYRKALIEKIGQEKLDWLEGEHELNRYTAEQYMEISKHYREQIKLMEANPNHELVSYQ